MAKKRPKHLNLIQIKLPLPGIVSILHRVSGAGLFLLIPFVLLMLQSSLVSAEGFAAVKHLLSGAFAKLILLGLMWALLHHFFAGLRYLAMDLHYCLDMPQARRASWLVLGASLSLTFLFGVWLW